MNIDLLLRVITAAAWILWALYVVYLLVRTTRKSGIKASLIKLFSLRVIAPLVLVMSLSFLSLSLVFIMPQQVGVVISILQAKGYRDQPMSSGLKWIVPLAENVIRYPIFWQTYTMSGKPLEGDIKGDDSIVARTADGQEVSLDCSVIFRIDANQVIRVYIGWQERYVQDFVRPTVRGEVRTLVSQYSVDEVNSDKRADLEAALDANLRTTFEEKGFILDQFVLRNIDFSDQYRNAVEEKQVAEQQMTQREHQAEQIRKLAAGEADRLKIVAGGEAEAIIIKAKADAQARVVKAQADAQALTAIGQAINERTDLITYEYVNKLSPGIKVMLVPNENPYILPLPTLGPDFAQTPFTSTETMTPTLSFTLPESDISIPLPEVTLTPTPLATATPMPEQ